jgi:isopentenyl-diphosphate delta-isomerase
VSREDAHNDASLIHREVAVILISEDGKALLAQRSFKKKVLPGKWDVTCAGHVPYGMETESAAHMELQEELGFDVPLQYIGTQLALYDWETHLTHLYIGVYSGEEVSLQEEEVEQSALLTKEDVNQLGEEVNLEFRDFIYSALANKLPPAKPWKKEQDLRNL